MTSSFLVADLDLALLEDLRNEREREKGKEVQSDQLKGELDSVKRNRKSLKGASRRS